MYIARARSRASLSSVQRLVIRTKTQYSKALADYDVGLLYGTHTGASHQNAVRMDREMNWRLGLKSFVAGMEEFDYDLENIPDTKTLLLFVTTYGQGEPTDNAQDFFIAVRDSQTLKFNYSVFGRGSSAYPTFNAAGQALDAKLEQLGAHRLSPYRQSDKLGLDNEDLFFGWKEDTFAQLTRKYNVEEQPMKYIPQLEVQEVAPPKDQGKWPSPSDREVLDLLARRTSHRPAPAMATFTRKIHNDKFGRTFVEGSFDLGKTSHTYDAGDYLVVWPENSDSEVDLFLAAMGLEGKRNYMVVVSSKWRATYYQLAKRFLDINAEVNRDTLRMFTLWAPNEESKNRLNEILANAEQFAELRKEKFNIGRFLSYVSGGVPWKVPPPAVLEVIPNLEPRDYSISSSPLKDPHVADVGAVTETVGEWKGVATDYLQSIPDGSEVPVATEQSTFRMPKDHSKPLILVSVGTGISPYRGFVEDRLARKARGEKTGPVYLFCGFRSKDSFLYREFFEQAEDTHVFPAYSREGLGVYVQDLVAENGELVYDLLENQDAYFYICGSARILRRHINLALGLIYAKMKNIELPETKPYLKKLKNTKRMNKDMW